MLTKNRTGKIVYWHRELPPLEADMLGEHTVEATSDRVEGTMASGDDAWGRCYLRLMTATRVRLEQEVARLGGDYAHVLDESIDTRRDEAANQSWLHGRFTYVLWRRPA